MLLELKLFCQLSFNAKYSLVKILIMPCADIGCLSRRYLLINVTSSSAIAAKPRCSVCKLKMKRKWK